MDRSRALIDLTPKQPRKSLPRGVSHTAEYEVFDANAQKFVSVSEYRYETAFGIAHVSVFAGNSLDAGLSVAERLLRNSREPVVVEGKARGIVNSVKNYEDLFSGSPLNLAISRSGCYTEADERKLLDIITGRRIAPSNQHRQMVARPGLVFSYHPYEPDTYVRLKPGFVPPEVKLKYITPFKTAQNQILYAGNIIAGRSPQAQSRIQNDVDHMLWLTEGEKKANCLSLVPLLTGAKLDVLGIPGVWMWGTKQEGDWVLSPELAAYKLVDGDRHRIVGILFDQDSWRNPKVADALLRLARVLKKGGALVVVGVIPPGTHQKGIDDFFVKHCQPSPTTLDLNPLLDILDNACYVDHDYTVTYPRPEEELHIRNLSVRAAKYEAMRESLSSENFDQVTPEEREQLVRFVSPAIYDGITVDEAWACFSEYPESEQADIWAKLMRLNPFQRDLDDYLDRFIPAIFRSRNPGGVSYVTCAQLQEAQLAPERLKGLCVF